MYWHLDAVVSVRERDTETELQNSPIQLFNRDALIRSVSSAIIEGYSDKALRSGSIAMIRDHATLLLQQFDRLQSEIVLRTKNEQIELQSWHDYCDDKSTCSIVQGLFDVLRNRYADGMLHVPTASSPVVSIIIPTFNNFSYTYDCLRSISLSETTFPFEVVLVDDASTDETLLLNLLISGVQVVRNSRNLGFVGSVMAGVGKSTGDYILLLNNDTTVEKQALQELYRTLEDNGEIGVVGSKLLSVNGSLQECGGVVWRDGDAWNFGRNDNPNSPDYCYMRDTDYVSGAALMTRRTLWQTVGGLSVEFSPGYYEDTDYCFKVREAGFRVVVQPTSWVTHHEGATAGSDVSGTGMKRFQQLNLVKFEKRWRKQLGAHSMGGADVVRLEAQRTVTKRVLVIDDTILTPRRDAGSVSMLGHMKCLIKLKYQVHFVPSHNMARIDPYTRDLERIGIYCHHHPFERSVEEVIKLYPDHFDVVYVHRVSNAAYIPVIKAARPSAVVVYNVADLHHIRLEREASLSEDPILHLKAQAIKQEELTAVRQADVTIVASLWEQNYLLESILDVDIALVPWPVDIRPTSRSFARRFGIAFVGSNHAPNVDGIKWFLDNVYRKVLEISPGITLHLVGDHVEDLELAAKIEEFNLSLVGPALIQTAGLVPDLVEALSHRRLTVAPLRYGAGLKGKVLDSFAQGIPCIMTSIAAEGADLTAPLHALVADDPCEIAKLVASFHDEEDLNSLAAQEGLCYAADRYSAARIENLLESALRIGQRKNRPFA